MAAEPSVCPNHSAERLHSVSFSIPPTALRGSDCSSYSCRNRHAETRSGAPAPRTAALGMDAAGTAPPPVPACPEEQRRPSAARRGTLPGGALPGSPASPEQLSSQRASTSHLLGQAWLLALHSQWDKGQDDCTSTRPGRHVVPSKRRVQVTAREGWGVGGLRLLTEKVQNHHRKGGKKGQTKTGLGRAGGGGGGCFCAERQGGTNSWVPGTQGQTAKGWWGGPSVPGNGQQPGLRAVGEQSRRASSEGGAWFGAC